VDVYPPLLLGNQGPWMPTNLAWICSVGHTSGPMALRLTCIGRYRDTVMYIVVEKKQAPRQE